jgi:IclR family KDG regulon transcriptional repressor
VAVRSLNANTMWRSVGNRSIIGQVTMAVPVLTIPDGVMLRTLDKGLTILEALATIGREGTTSVALGRRLGLHRTTVHRFLQTLTMRGYVEQISESDRYRLGLGALRLAAASMTGLTLRDVGMPVLEALGRETSETVQTVILDPSGEVVTIDRLDAEHPIGLRTHIGARRPAYCSAAGKAMLAFKSEAEVDEILARGMPARTPSTVTDPLLFKAQLWEVTRRGFAVDDEENLEGVRCVAAPVFDFDGRLAGAVSLMAPLMRVDSARVIELGECTAKAARTLSYLLGYHDAISTEPLAMRRAKATGRAISTPKAAP